MDHSNMNHTMPEINGTNHHNHHQMNNTGNHMMGHQMPMYFHGGTMVTLFFKDWMTMNQSEFDGACVALFVLATLYEGLKILRKFLLVKMLNDKKVRDVNPSISKSSQQKDDAITIHNKQMFKIRVIVHLIQTVLHVIQVFLGYLLMLAFMTYNSLVCVSILLGYGFGYLVFAWYDLTIANGVAVKTNDSDCCNL
ncbi:high affinity copper uptake protein 1-like [Clytia hemisphaerica]|uniref:Copper transport protein n=1 Tax=Clytia hemisphaerica TaxID=252671 RepID=A0A7M5V2J4_9CNID|eukprot:TCONS_00045653-protein